LIDLVGTVLPGAGAPRPVWDCRGDYSVTNVDIFYLASSPSVVAAAAAGSAAEPWQDLVVGISASAAASAPEMDEDAAYAGFGQDLVQCTPTDQLGTVLAKPDHIVADVPVLFVAARGTAFHAHLSQRISRSLRGAALTGGLAP